MDRCNEDLDIKVEQLFDKTRKSYKNDGSRYQLLMCALANMAVLGPSMGFGYSAVALPSLRSNSTEGLHVNEQQASWIASALAMGTPIGCIISSFVMRRGRKLSLLTTSGVSLIGWLTIYFSNTYEQILVGRILSGISMGLASVPATVYSAEVTSPSLRSTTLTWTSIAIACGVLIVYILGFIFPENWNVVALACAVFPTIAIILSAIFLPESPVWLKDHGYIDEATKTLKKFNGISQNLPLPADIEEQIKPKTSRCVQDRKIFKILLSRKSIEPLIIMLCFFFFQQFSGIFAIVYYAVNVTNDAGLIIDGYLGAILIGITRLFGTFVVASVSEKLGRKLPSVASGIGMSVFLTILSIYLFLKSQQYVINDGGLVPAICLLMYIFMSTIGFLTLPFAMIGEIYPTSVKDILSGMTSCFAYVFSFITVKIYPDMIAIMSEHGVFFFYAVMSICGTLFVVVWLPETKGKSLAQIEDLFENKKKTNNIVTNDGVECDKDIMTPLKPSPKICRNNSVI